MTTLVVMGVSGMGKTVVARVGAQEAAGRSTVVTCSVAVSALV